MLGASFAAMIEGVSVSEAAFAVAVVGGFVFAIDGEGYGRMLGKVLLEEGLEKLDRLGAVALALMGKVDKEGAEAKLIGQSKIILFGIVGIDVEKADNLLFNFNDIEIPVRRFELKNLVNSANKSFLLGMDF
jgi:hypothetical protein